MQPPFKLRSSKWCLVSSLRVTEYSNDKQRLWSDCAHAQAGLSLCWWHIPHCWKSYAAAQIVFLAYAWSHSFFVSCNFCCLLITFANSLYPDQDCRDLDGIYLTLWLCSCKNFFKRLILKEGNRQQHEFQAPCTDSESFVRVGPTQLWQSCIFLVDEGRENPSAITKRGPSSVRQQNAIEMVFRADWYRHIKEYWLGGFVISRGSSAVLLRNPIVLWFSRGSPDPLSPPLDLHMSPHTYDRFF